MEIAKEKKTMYLTKASSDLLLDNTYQIQKETTQKIAQGVLVDIAIQYLLKDRPLEEIIEIVKEYSES